MASKCHETASSAGEYNNPWNGDTFTYAVGKADYVDFVRSARAVYDGEAEEFAAPMSEDEYIVREITARIDFERSKVLALRQDAWDAANSFLYRTLLGSLRVMHSIIRSFLGDGVAVRGVLCVQCTRVLIARVDGLGGILVRKRPLARQLEAPLI